MVTLEGSSTDFSVETSRDIDWTCLGLLSRWNKLCRNTLCRVYWAIILTISCHLEIVALTKFSAECAFSSCVTLCIQLKYKLLSINWPNIRKIRSIIAEKSQSAESGKEIKEKKEKTTQQQKGLSTLSAHLKKTHAVLLRYRHQFHGWHSWTRVPGISVYLFKPTMNDMTQRTSFGNYGVYCNYWIAARDNWNLTNVLDDFDKDYLLSRKI